MRCTTVAEQSSGPDGRRSSPKNEDGSPLLTRKVYWYGGLGLCAGLVVVAFCGPMAINFYVPIPARWQVVGPTQTSVSVISPTDTPSSSSVGSQSNISDRQVIFTVTNPSGTPLEGAIIEVLVSLPGTSQKPVDVLKTDSNGEATLFVHSFLLEEVLEAHRQDYGVGYDPIFEDVSFSIDVHHSDQTPGATLLQKTMVYWMPTPDIMRIADKLGVSYEEAKEKHDRIVGTGIEQQTIRLNPLQYIPGESGQLDRSKAIGSRGGLQQPQPLQAPITLPSLLPSPAQPA